MNQSISKHANQPGFRVTVFGGSQPKPDDAAYQQAFELGQLLGSAGCLVLTGGYMGTMEAVSRGAAESGGHVIGVTCDEIETWRPTRHNRWVQEERRYPTLRERLYALVDACDAAIALPGGIGTLAEIALMWSQMQISPASPRPLVLVGVGWQQVLAMLYENLNVYVSEYSRSLITFSPDVRTAFASLQIERSRLNA
jgi:uncharacterized protein (TIGR00730 family)